LLYPVDLSELEVDVMSLSSAVKDPGLLYLTAGLRGVSTMLTLLSTHLIHSSIPSWRRGGILEHDATLAVAFGFAVLFQVSLTRRVPHYSK